MILNQLREARRKRPFCEFSIGLADGTELRVTQAESVAVGPRVAILVADDDAIVVLRPRMIKSVSCPANGKDNPRRRRKS